MAELENLKDRAEAAWDAWQAANDVEPPFSEDHHRYHTPARPLDDCAVCVYLQWVVPDSYEHDLFVAGFAAGVEAAPVSRPCAAHGDPLHSRCAVHGCCVGHKAAECRACPCYVAAAP
jgi:hypothetical protein